MESDCRIPVACCRPRVLVLHALFWGLVSLRVFGAALLSDERTSVVKAVVAPCWLLEDFVVTTECLQCNAFQTRTWSACGATGYVERVNCTKSNRDEHKRSEPEPNPALSSLLVSVTVLTPPYFSASCRSTVMEEHLFWKFEAAMLALTAVFGVLVVVRQRWLDRLASEKVRRQIESI
ncbi:Protein JTB [Nibea albiflora]|uniref:Protein JTB n=1 Tax=Nibea albiflora TaxID=240163 RepID=A0ACB7ERW0_NIBAL|nr:Protein JTB [Nibea albiflora]